MSEEKDLTTEIDEKSEETKSKPEKSFGKMGKIFLLAGIVLAQAAGSYAIVDEYYPEMRKLTSQFQSSGGVYYEFEDIIVNPAESNGERYLILSITVELNNGGDLSTLDHKKAEVQDRINTVISNHTSVELHSLSKRDNIKKELGIVINKVIGKKSVRNLFFTKYVLQ